MAAWPVQALALALLTAAPTRVHRPVPIVAGRAASPRSAPRAAVPTPQPPREGGARRSRARRNKYAEFSRAHEELGAQLERGELGTPVEAGRRRPANPLRALDPARAGANRTRGEVNFPDTSEIDPDDPATFGFLEIGRVLDAHGVRGELKVLSDSHFADERLCTPGERYLKLPKRLAPRPVRLLSGARARTLRSGQGAVFTVVLEGSTSRDAALALKGCRLFSRAEERPASLADDEYLAAQIVGCEVRLLDPQPARGGGGEERAEGGGEGPSAEQPALSEADVAALADPARRAGRVVGVVCAEEISGSPGLGNDLLDIEKEQHSDPPAAGAAAEGGGGGGGGGGARAAGGRRAKLAVAPARPAERVLVPFVPALCPHVDVRARVVGVRPVAGLMELVQPSSDEEVFIRGALPPATE